MPRGERLEFRLPVEIGARANAVDQRDRRVVALRQEIEDHRARARHAGAAGQEQQRPTARLTHEEAAVGPGEGQPVADLQRLVQRRGGAPADDLADLQLDVAGLLRRIGDREGAGALDAGNGQIDVLPGLEVDGRAAEIETDALDVMGEIVERRDGRGMVGDRDAALVGILVDLGLDGDVVEEPRRAGERLAVGAFEVHQREGGRIGVIDLPVDDVDLAGAAQAVAAGMGVALVQRCLVEEDLAAGRVALALPAPVHIERGYFLCRPAARAPSEAFVQFREWLLEQAAPGAVPPAAVPGP